MGGVDSNGYIFDFFSNLSFFGKMEQQALSVPSPGPEFRVGGDCWGSQCQHCWGWGKFLKSYGQWLG